MFVSLPCAKVLQALLVFRPCWSRRVGDCSLCWEKIYLGKYMLIPEKIHGCRDLSFGFWESLGHIPAQWQFLKMRFVWYFRDPHFPAASVSCEVTRVTTAPAGSSHSCCRIVENCLQRCGRVSMSQLDAQGSASGDVGSVDKSELGVLLALGPGRDSQCLL